MNEESSEIASLIQNQNEEKEKDVDEIFMIAGGFGRFQLLLLIVGIFMSISFSYQTVVMYFAADDPPWQCVSNATSDFCQLHLNWSISQSSKQFVQRCHIPRNEWEYTTSFKYSILTEYDLVCKRQYLKSLTSSVFFIGSGLGSVLSGPITDNYGRKLMVCGSTLLLFLSSCSSAYITEVWQFILLRTVIGISFGGINVSLYVLLTESMPAKKRSLVSNILLGSWGCGFLLLALLAYYVQIWRQLLFLSSFTTAASFILSLGLFESPNWLNLNRKSTAALRILRKISAFNGKPLDEGIKLKSNVKEGSDSTTYSYIHFFNNIKAFSLVFAQCFLWLSAALMSYGVIFEGASLGGNIYFNFAVSTLAEIPSFCLVVPATTYIGRKTCSFWSFFLSALLVCGIGFVPEDLSIARIVMATISKMFLNIAFYIVYLWSFEIFPTILRSQGMNLCQISTRVGAATAPFITDILTNVTFWLPFVIMAGTGIGSALLSFVLPETRNKPIRQTYEDMLERPSDSLHVQVDDMQSDIEN